MKYYTLRPGLNQENISGERSQTKNTTYFIIPFLWNVQKKQIYSIRNEICACLKLGERMLISCRNVLKLLCYEDFTAIKNLLQLIELNS